MQTPADAYWAVVVPGNAFAQGSPTRFSVIGPPNQTFLLAVTGPPYNQTPPVFEMQGITGRAYDSSFGQDNLTMPTKSLPPEGYQAALFVQGALVNRTYFSVVIPFNATLLNNTIEEILVQQAIDEGILYGVREQLAQARATQTEQWFVVLGAVVICALLVLYRERAEVARSAANLLSRWLNRRYWSTVPPAFRVRGDGPVPAQIEHIVPGALWYADYCAACRDRDWKESALRAHIESRHPDVVGPRGAIRGTHYLARTRSVRREVRTAPTVDDVGAARVRAQHDRRRPVTSLDEIFAQAREDGR